MFLSIGPNPDKPESNCNKLFGIRILQIVRIKIKWLESGRFGKSGYHYKIFAFFAKIQL